MRDWSQLITFFIGMTVLVLWVDSRNHNEIVSIRETVDAIHSEMKDFHGRLCVMEERNLNREI